MAEPEKAVSNRHRVSRIAITLIGFRLYVNVGSFLVWRHRSSRGWSLRSTLLQTRMRYRPAVRRPAPLTGGSYGVPPLRRMGILSLITTYHILTKKSNKKARACAAFCTKKTTVSLEAYCTKENAPKPPLCKGRWHGVSRDGGIVRQEPTNSP